MCNKNRAALQQKIIRGNVKTLKTATQRVLYQKAVKALPDSNAQDVMLESNHSQKKIKDMLESNHCQQNNIQYMYCTTCFKKKEALVSDEPLLKHSANVSRKN